MLLKSLVLLLGSYLIVFIVVRIHLLLLLSIVVFLTVLLSILLLLLLHHVSRCGLLHLLWVKLVPIVRLFLLLLCILL